MKKFPRDVITRVNKLDGDFDPMWVCMLCGNKFMHSNCTHSEEENQEVIEQVRGDK